MPQEMRIPAIGLTVQVAADPCPLVDGMITPDIDTPEEACTLVVEGKPYALPSTGAPDLAAIAGHTWARNGADWQGNIGTAAFNALYDWDEPDPHFTVHAGDEIWIRTSTSGANWLVYRAADFFRPLKYGDGPDSLSGSTDIWGTGAQPGRLLTIGCLRESDDPEGRSQRNIVVAWAFDRVATDAP